MNRWAACRSSVAAALFVLAASVSSTWAAPPAATSVAPATGPADVAGDEAWAYDLDGAFAETAWINGDTIYLFIRSGSDFRQRSFFTAPPGVEPLREDPKASGSGRDPLLAGIDAGTGKVRWVRAVLGDLLFAIDPGGRDLWALGADFRQIDADTGNITRTVPLKADATGGRRRYSARGITGLRIKGRLVRGSSEARNGTGESVTAYDIDQGALIEARSAEHTADGQWRVEKQDMESANERAFTRFVMLSTQPGNARWYSDFRGVSTNEPAIFEDDPIVLTGGTETAAVAMRLDAHNGLPKWSTPLPAGAYTVRVQQNSLGRSPQPIWSAIGKLDADSLYAIDANGVVYILDGATGRIVGSASNASRHLCAPQVLNGKLVIVGESGIFSLPLDTVRGSRRETAQAKQAKSDLAAALVKGDVDDAWKRVSDLVYRWPDDVEARRRQLDVALRRPVTPPPPPDRRGTDPSDHDGEGDGVLNDRTRALARWLEAGGDPGAAELDGFGLLSYTRTGPIGAAMLPAGRLLYAPGMDGVLYTLDTDANLSGNRLVATSRMGGAAWESRLMNGNQLVRLGDSWSVEHVLTVAGVPDDLARANSDDPLRSPMKNDGSFELRGLNPGAPVPPAWAEWARGLGPIVEADGRLIRTLTDGDVRELTADGVIVHKHDRSKPRPGDWALVRTPSGGFVGCGSGGVYKLDENFRPTDLIVRPEAAGNQRPLVLTARVAGDSMGIVVGVSPLDSLYRFELWSGEPMRRIRQEVVLAPHSGQLGDPSLILRCGNGYLYAGGELLWLPDDPTRPAWRFRTSAQGRKPQAGVRVMPDHRGGAFGFPRIIGSRMFVANRSGGIYEFDLERITR